MKLTDYVTLKLELLTNGISYADGFLSFYSRQNEYIEKRRAYGTGDGLLSIAEHKTPQEILLGNEVICAANYEPNSPWKLSANEEGAFVGNGEHAFPVSFPIRPSSYGMPLSNGDSIERVLTVYGDTTLGIFSPGHCYYFNDERQCRFCSLGAARAELSDHRMKVLPELATEAVNITLGLEPGRYRRVLLNGGTIPNYNKGFSLHTEILTSVAELNTPPEFGFHLISMPPVDYGLFKPLKSIGATLAMSLEIFDETLFKQLCPGKAEDYGRTKFIDAFEAAVNTLGRGNVYVGFVAGIEPIETLIHGMEFFGEMGVVPAVAVFHPDAGSHLSMHPRPTMEYLRTVGISMSKIYQQHGFRPFIEGSGRNALDTEAFLQGF
jgi:hypothetical protein